VASTCRRRGDSILELEPVRVLTESRHNDFADEQDVQSSQIELPITVQPLQEFLAPDQIQALSQSRVISKILSSDDHESTLGRSEHRSVDTAEASPHFVSALEPTTSHHGEKALEDPAVTDDLGLQLYVDNEEENSVSGRGIAASLPPTAFSI